MAGGLMQIELSYKLQVMRRRPAIVMSTPISGGQFVSSLEEQDLTETVNQEPNRWYQAVQFSIPVNNAIKKMFDDAGPEDEFDYQIVVKYEYPGLQIPSYVKSYPESPVVFAPKRAVMA
jgi:hypothetical protein